VQATGDQFTVFDNGIPMSAAASPFTAPGQNPGQVSPGGGRTSVPVLGGPFTNNINEALGNADFSSATFALLAGTNDITMQFDGSVGGGDMAFIAEVPLPATLPLFASGLGGLGLLGWRRKRRARAVA